MFNFDDSPHQTGISDKQLMKVCLIMALGFVAVLSLQRYFLALN